MKVVWTKKAQADLADIGTYISRDSPTRARTFVSDIIACGDDIGDLPRGFPIVPRFEHLAIRRRLIGRYLILYRVRTAAVEILHVLHSARDYTRVLAIEEFDDE